EGSLRELSRSLEPMSILERPLAEVLRSEVDKFEARGLTRVTLELGGELEGLTASQRITIYRIVQEGLSNVRDHSEADTVRVTGEMSNRCAICPVESPRRTSSSTSDWRRVSSAAGRPGKVTRRRRPRARNSSASAPRSSRGIAGSPRRTASSARATLFGPVLS